MANTTVTDALMYSNVTQTNAGNGKKVQPEGISFAQTMTDVTSIGSSYAGADVKTSDNATRTGVESTTKVVEDKAPTENNKVANGDSKVQDEGRDAKLAGDALEKANEVKDAIKDTMGVSDEDIESAMENMGYMIWDLLDPAALKDLLMQLAGVEDSMDLLTNADLYEGIQNIIGVAEKSSQALADTFDCEIGDVIGFVKDGEGFAKALSESDINLDSLNRSKAEYVSGFAKSDDNKGLSTMNGNSDIRVEITRSDAVRTEVFKPVDNTKGSADTSDNQSGSLMQQTQTSVVTSVNELGQIVETIETYSTGADAQEIVSQVTQSIKLNFSAESTSMELMLHPASLGTVNMQVSSQNGVVTAHLLVQNEAVKSALETQLATLIDTLKEQGQEVEAVEVSVANYDLNRGMNQNADERERENALRAGRIARRRLNLDEITQEDEELLDDEEKITADMMRRQGNSVDFMA